MAKPVAKRTSAAAAEKEGAGESQNGDANGADAAAEARQSEEAAAKDDSPRRRAQNKASPKQAAAAKQDDNGDHEDDELNTICKMMQERQFTRAAAQLTRILKKVPDDPVALHNLGVVYTELEKWVEAEETFTAAYEAQKKNNTYNDATMFGLATVLTEQGDMGKLMQGEAIFRDCLDRAIAKEEDGILETYRTFTALGENLGVQKRWTEAVEAHRQSLMMGEKMFGEGHERNVIQRTVLARAERLAGMQKWIRRALWGATAALPIFCAWMWNKAGGPSPSEIIFGTSASGAAAADLLPSAADVMGPSPIG